MNKNNIIICRCEDITLADLHEYMDRGFTTFEDLKRQLRVGMGPCQATTCGELIQRELANYLNLKPENIKTHKTRPLTTGIKLKSIAEAAKDES